MGRDRQTIDEARCRMPTTATTPTPADDRNDRRRPSIDEQIEDARGEIERSPTERRVASARARRDASRADAEARARDDDDLTRRAPPRRRDRRRLWKILAAPLRAAAARFRSCTLPRTSSRDIRASAPAIVERLWRARRRRCSPTGTCTPTRSCSGSSARIRRCPARSRCAPAVKNVADFAQPYPLLRLVLEDR